MGGSGNLVPADIGSLYTVVEAGDDRSRDGSLAAEAGKTDALQGLAGGICQHVPSRKGQIEDQVAGCLVGVPGNAGILRIEGEGFVSFIRGGIFDGAYEGVVRIIRFFIFIDIDADVDVNRKPAGEDHLCDNPGSVRRGIAGIVFQPYIVRIIIDIPVDSFLVGIENVILFIIGGIKAFCSDVIRQIAEGSAIVCTGPHGGKHIRILCSGGKPLQRGTEGSGKSRQVVFHRRIRQYRFIVGRRGKILREYLR